VLTAELASAHQLTEYEVTHAEAGSAWCSSSGKSGVPTGRSASLQPAPTGNLELVGIPLQGLADGHEYCAILSAHNATASVSAIMAEAFPMNDILTVVIGGSGTGTVRTNSPRISCPGACSAAYRPGELATLNPEPAPGSAFSGWSICARRSVRRSETGGLAGERARTPATLARSAAKRCRKGEVRTGKGCVSNAPVRYGKVTLAVPAAGMQKLRIKPSGKILAAPRNGKTLSVRVTLVFTPAGTTDRLTQTSTVTVRVEKHAGHGRHKP
jgi:hypothetical protein